MARNILPFYPLKLFPRVNKDSNVWIMVFVVISWFLSVINDARERVRSTGQLQVVRARKT